MTNERILELAYIAALEIWDKERTHLEALPDNEFAKAREQKAWNELTEISEMKKALEK